MWASVSYLYIIAFFQEETDKKKTPTNAGVPKEKISDELFN